MRYHYLPTNSNFGFDYVEKNATIFRLKNCLDPTILLFLWSKTYKLKISVTKKTYHIYKSQLQKKKTYKLKKTLLCNTKIYLASSFVTTLDSILEEERCIMFELQDARLHRWGVKELTYASFLQASGARSVILEVKTSPGPSGFSIRRHGDGSRLHD